MGVLGGTKGFYEFEVTDSLAFNVKNWLDYGLLELGAFTSVEFVTAASGYTNLERVDDSRYGSSRVYEGLGSSWVWESGVNVVPADTNAPFQVSGVYVDNIFNNISGVGPNSFNVDYANGRIIFDADITATKVQCQYCFRDVEVAPVDSPKWKTLVDQYADRFDTLQELSPSGMASILKDYRVWMPSVFIEVQDKTNTGLQLGGGELTECQVLYHIFSDMPFSNNRLCDVISNQDHKTLHLFDLNNIPYPLNFDGTLYSGALTYPDLSKDTGEYFWTYAHVEDSAGGPIKSDTDVFRGEIRQTISVARYMSTY